MSASTATSSQPFGSSSLENAVEAWVAHWDMTNRVAPKMPANERLRTALTAFLGQQLDDADDATPRAVTIGLALAAVTRSGTHSRPVVEAVFAELRGPVPQPRTSPPLLRYWLATTVVWIAAVGSWWLVFGDSYSDDRIAAGLAALPPALVALAFLAYRWARR